MKLPACLVPQVETPFRDAYPDDIDGDGVYDDAWPWPRLLRITMSFADPVDQTVEDTFQFVVELPKDGDL